ncbi:MAG: hypothetical protein J6P43_06350, partial [Succinivibrionaceae bacterium]|nr:hypothetical protein [Succinivibrionaceae bacterium]
PAESDNSSAEPAKPETPKTPSNLTVVPVNPNKPINPSEPSGDSNNSADSKDDKNSGDSNDENNSGDSNDDNNSDEQNNTVETGILKVKVIDGYMKGIPVCVVDETKPSLPCDERFSPSEDTTEYTTGDKGDIEINLDKDRIDILKEKGFVKFKATVPKGVTDNILGTDTETDRDYMLVGTKYFDEDTFNSQIDDDAPAFVVSPFTTIADIVLRNKESSVEIYKATVDTITASLGIDNTVMTDITATDYGTPELCGGDKEEAQCIKALIAGETLVRTGYIPQPEDTEKLDLTVDIATIAERLETRVKPMVNYIAGMNEVTPGSIAEYLAAYLATQKYRFEALSTGISDDWRCAVNRLSEVMCWGNNAWNNLGDPKFTEEKKKPGGIYDGGNVGNIANIANIAFLVGNYSPIPLNVKIRNEKVTDENAPDYYVNLTGVSKVMTGNGHACAITHYGEVYCWGENSSAQLGWGETEYTTANMSVGYARKVVTGAQNSGSGFLSNVVDLSLGVNHSCALTNVGDIYCWGDNTAKELGGDFVYTRLLQDVTDINGQSLYSYNSYNHEPSIVKIVPNPVRVPAPDGIKFNYISKSGYWAHCALSTQETSEKDDDGRIKNLWCWGNDASGLVSQNNSEYVAEMSTLTGYVLTSYYRNDTDDRKSYTESYLNICNVYGCPPNLTDSWWNKIDEDKNGITLREGADFWYWYVADSLVYYPRYTKWPRIGKGITNVTQVKYGSDDVDIRNLTFVDIGRDENAYKMDSYLITVSSDEPNNVRVSRTDSTTGTPDSSIYDYDSPIKGIWTNSRYDTRFVNKHDTNIDADALVGIGNRQYNLMNRKSSYNPIDYDVTILSEEQIIDVSAIQRSVCALVRDETASDNSNKMKCWGSNTFGQIPGIDEMGISTSFLQSFGYTSMSWQFVGVAPEYLVANRLYDNSQFMSGVTDVVVDFPSP